MRNRFFLFFLLFLFLSNCGYNPIYSTKNLNFAIGNIEKNNTSLNNKFAKSINALKSNDNDKEINIKIESNNKLKESGFLSNDYLTMRRLEIEHEILNTKKRIIDCLAGYVDCVIYPSLAVAVCESTKPFANLKKFDFDLIKLLNSESAKKIRKLTSKCACTHPCHLSDSMAYDTKFLKEYFSSKR